MLLKKIAKTHNILVKLAAYISYSLHVARSRVMQIFQFLISYAGHAYKTLAPHEKFPAMLYIVISSSSSSSNYDEHGYFNYLLLTLLDFKFGCVLSASLSCYTTPSQSLF